MEYDSAEEHLKSAYLGAAKCLSALRERGLSAEAEKHVVDYEFVVWSMVDRLTGGQK